MAKINLPPGCIGLDCKDGTKYTADRPGGSVEVTDRHSDAVKGGQFSGDANLLSGAAPLSFGTKRSRRCAPCGRIWNAWSTECPKCGEPTAEWSG